MSERYDNYIISVRTSAILTGSYVAATITRPDTSSALDSLPYNKLVLLVDFTIGSLTTAEVKIEFSSDNTNWYQETVGVATAGTIAETLVEHQLSATGKYRIAVPILDKYIRVSAKGTGTATNSLLAVSALVGRV